MVRDRQKDGLRLETISNAMELKGPSIPKKLTTNISALRICFMLVPSNAKSAKKMGGNFLRFIYSNIPQISNILARRRNKKSLIKTGRREKGGSVCAAPL